MNKSNFEDLKKHYSKNGIKCTWLDGCKESHFISFESKFKIGMILQLQDFYEWSNGLEVISPSLKIYSIENLIGNSKYLEFCIIDKIERFGFDITSNKIDGRWDIYHINSNKFITHTFASFLFNKLNKWSMKEIRFWEK